MSLDQAYLFNRGEDHMSYNLLGSRPAADQAGRTGYAFAVWAPQARAVAVAGSFNAWDASADPLQPLGTTGIWTGFVPGARHWDRYKYAVTGQTGMLVLKADPYARHSETRPDNASILYDPCDYAWQDSAWMARRPDALAGPLNIYEVHLGSWRRAPDGSFLNYRDIACQLGPYLQLMGYKAVELLPVMEHPLDESWGYQVTGFFSVTSRYGTPADFKYLVDTLHGLGIRVILDWVPAHFPRDAHGLACFDGSALFEHADRRIGEQPEWGTLVFDYGKSEVRSFLMSSAWFWLQEMHADGLRFDAVSSMLYRDYGRSDFLLNADGGKENYEAIAFLRQLNGLVREKLPSCLLIAEESTAWPKVSHPVSDGGLGFTHKWDMGWMHDTLDYLACDFSDRGCHHNQLSFSMFYAFSERFILPLSHDEVVHGKRSLIGRMPGDVWRQAAGLRTLYLYQMTHPGGKLLFMGGEFGQFVEWRFGQELEWFLLEMPHHRQLQEFVAALNHYYLVQPAFWQTDTNWDGFTWISADDATNSVYTYLRRTQSESQAAGLRQAMEDCRVVILNLSPEPRQMYRLGVPSPGAYHIDLNSDDRAFGGSGYPPGQANADVYLAEPLSSHGQPASLALDLPPLCGLILRPVP